MGDELKGYAKLSKELCEQKIVEIKSAKQLLKFLIIENAHDEKAWGNSLMILLCGCLNLADQYSTLLLEILDATSNVEEDLEVLKVELKYVDILQSQATLLKISEFDLLYKHGISLTLH